MKEAFEQGDHMQQIKLESQVQISTPTRGQASSSSWEGPITDSQAVAVSDYLLTEQETAQYYSEDGEAETDVHKEEQIYDENNKKSEPTYEDVQDLGSGPSWEIEIPPPMRSIEYPRNMEGYTISGENAYDAYFKACLDEVMEPPPSDTYYW